MAAVNTAISNVFPEGPEFSHSKYLPTTESASMYKKHFDGTMVSNFLSEREEYAKNKTRANQGGDWWGSVDNESSIKPLSFETGSGRNGIVGGKQIRTNDFGKFDVTANVQDGEWLAHRRRKYVDKDSGKNFNILTGLETQTSSGGIKKTAKRISMDKILSTQQTPKYNIISNT
ncbi:hypothetical protein HDU76_011238 [Blyttiomyces sp. JEL0837]|nr:hypothetical protein HDU76_011238 [Blyttiomyces sp. JEL0837]